MNPVSRFNVINPIDRPFSDNTDFRADIPFDWHHFVLNVLDNEILLKSIIETQESWNHILIHEVYFNS